MRQEVRALVALTFDADARLTASQLADSIEASLQQSLIWEDLTDRPVEAVAVDVIAVREEAEIYGNEA